MLPNPETGSLQPSHLPPRPTTTDVGGTKNTADLHESEQPKAYGAVVEITDRRQELAAAVEGRPNWRIEGSVAQYAPPGKSTSVRVRAMSAPTRTVRFVAIVMRGDRAEHPRPASTAVEARQWAEAVSLD